MEYLNKRKVAFVTVARINTVYPVLSGLFHRLRFARGRINIDSLFLCFGYESGT